MKIDQIVRRSRRRLAELIKSGDFPHAQKLRSKLIPKGQIDDTQRSKKTSEG